MGGVVSRKRQAKQQPAAAASAAKDVDDWDAADAATGGRADAQEDMFRSPVRHASFSESSRGEPRLERDASEDPARDDSEDPEVILRQREEARRQRALALRRKPIPDPLTPVRIRQTLTDFLNKDFDSPQAMQAAVDEYANEVALLEMEGQTVSRLLTAGAAESGAPVNEIRSALDAFLNSPSRNMNELLDETARKLLHADVELPGSTASPRAAHDDVNPRAGSGIPPFTGQMPHTAASDVAYFASIRTEAQRLEAERRLAQQVAEMKQERQQAQLQHHFIQKLMAMKREEEEIGSVLMSAKVIREQKDLLRKWQVEQENLILLQEEERAVQQQLQKANDELMPMLVSHRTLKQGLDKVKSDELEYSKVIEELEWLESEEKAAAEGTREPLTQEQSFRMDFLSFKKTSWEQGSVVRKNRIAMEQGMYEEVDWAIAKQRQQVSVIKSDLQEVQNRVALAEASCQKLCDLSDELRGIFARLPTTRHPTAYEGNPDELTDEHGAHVADRFAEGNEVRLHDLPGHLARFNGTLGRIQSVEVGAQGIQWVNVKLDDDVRKLPIRCAPTSVRLAHAFAAAAAYPEEEDRVEFKYVAGCDRTHGIAKGSLEAGFATEYYYIGEEMDDRGPNLDALKPDAATTSQRIELEAPRAWPDNFPEECVAARWAGFIFVATDGQYTFSTESNDGSRLWVAGSLVVDNGGLHGMRRKEGMIALAAGLHTFKAEFFVSTGSPGMIVRMLGPDTLDAEGKPQEVVVEGFHVKGWEAVGAFESVQLGPEIFPVEEENVLADHAVDSSGEEHLLYEMYQQNAIQGGVGGGSPKSPAHSWSGSQRQPSLGGMFGRKDSGFSHPKSNRSFFGENGEDEEAGEDGGLESESRPATKSVRWDVGGVESPQGTKSVNWDGEHHERLVLRTAGTEASRPGP